MNISRFSTLSSAVILALGLSTAAIAEDISSSIRGTLTSVEGAPVTDATITIIHVPSGTRKTLKVNSNGVFSARGLRVGGPYTILIDSDAYKDRKINNVYINLGETLSLSEALESARGQVVTVTGRSLEGENFIHGSSSTFTASEINRTPAFNNDLKDIVKQNPLAVVLNNDETGLTIAGTNPKYNSLTVDGVRLDDDFGLQGNGYPTERSPISLEIVDQLSIVTSPFSTKYGGFSGGQMSVVTKSGGNDFHGSVYYQQAKDAWAGTPKDPDDGTKIPLTFNEKTKGATFSGPLIKDKLFFFGSYEKFEAPSQVQTGPQGDTSVPNHVSGVEIADVNEVVDIASSVYGYDAGVYNKSLPLTDEKYLIKLDWNVNDDHRAAFSYSHANSNSAANDQFRRSQLYLSSQWYNRSNKYDDYVLNLYSNWTDAFSSEIKVAYKDSTNGQVSLGGSDFGDVRVRTPGGGEIRLGPDQFRHANKLNNQTFQLRLAGEYLYNDHAISFGWEHDSVKVFNLFVFANLGVWRFDSIDDFRNGQASSFFYQNNPSLDVNNAAASFKLGTDALYAEDNWELSPELTITYGLRYERQSSNNTPAFNQGFFDRYGFANNTSVDGLDIILPRFGFEWAASDSLNVYGGFGRFSGGRPNVWLSNTFTNDGTRVVAFSENDPANLTGANPGVIPQNVLDAIASNPVGGGNIDALDPNFKIPSNWTYRMGFDFTTDFGPLGKDWKISSEVIYKKIDEDVKWSDVSRKLNTAINGGHTLAGQPIYTRLDSNRPSVDILLSNNSGGDSLIETFSLDKNWDSGVTLNFSYTHQDVNDRTPGTSSTSRSNYRFVSAYDRENLDIATSAYEIKHRMLLNLSYNHEFFEGYNTGMHLIWQRRSGRPFSWVLNDARSRGLDGNSSLHSSNLLPYIPTGPDDSAVAYASNYSYEQLVADLQNAGITSTGFLKRNAYRAPWTTTMDLLFSQEIPGLMEGHKGILTLDINNALALFDRKLAEVYIQPFGETTNRLLRYEINAQGQYVYSPLNTDRNNSNAAIPLDGGSPAQFRARESTWSIKLGVKYTF